LKISFLIPSKDRLELTTHAIASIRSQPCLDYEIVVVDNASAESYEDEIRKLDDPRIVFKRQEDPVAVTDNWRTSLALATGEYVLMLGDDDALAPCFGSVANDYLQADQPDLIYLASYHYCYPGVIPGQDAGYFASVLNSEFLEPGAVDPFCLTHDYAVDLARDILKFRYRIGLNAQHYLLKRSFLRQFEEIGGFYQSPYPDTFSSIAALLRASSIVVLPRELVIIGISPKSFGAYYFSGRQEEGYLFLDNIRVTPKIRASLEPVILPGDKNDTNWLIAAEAVRQTFPDVLGDSVDAGRYRALQVIAVLRTLPAAAALEDLRNRLLPAERPLFAALEACVRSVGDGDARSRLFAAIATAIGQYYPARVSVVDIGRHSHVGDAIDFLRRLDQGSIGEPAPSHPAEPIAVPAPERPAAAGRRADFEHKEIRGTVMSRVKEMFASLFPSARKHTERQARLPDETR
jgi:glycosyltransferase involved in cell wall biosynthesis